MQSGTGTTHTSIQHAIVFEEAVHYGAPSSATGLRSVLEHIVYSLVPSQYIIIDSQASTLSHSCYAFVAATIAPMVSITGLVTHMLLLTVAAASVFYHDANNSHGTDYKVRLVPCNRAPLMHDLSFWMHIKSIVHRINCKRLTPRT